MTDPIEPAEPTEENPASSTPAPKKIVLRAASKPSKGVGVPGDQPLKMKRTKAKAPKGDRKRPEDAPGPDRDSAANKGPKVTFSKRKISRPSRTPGMTLSVVGASATVVAPLLVWWRTALGTDGQVIGSLPKKIGVQSLPGLLCFTGGFVALVIAIMVTRRVLPRATQVIFAWTIVGAGSVATLGAVLALTGNGGIVTSLGLLISKQLGIYWALIAGLCTVAGGIVLERETHNPSPAPTPPTTGSPSEPGDPGPPETTSLGF